MGTRVRGTLPGRLADGRGELEAAHLPRGRCRLFEAEEERRESYPREF